MPDTTKSRGKKRRRARKSRLGLFTGLAVGLLVFGYLGVLEMSRPHVGGERVNYGAFIRIASQGRLENAHILDEDAYIIGRYTRDDGSVRPYNTPLLHGTQGDMLQILGRSGVENITIDQQVGKRVAAFATILLPGLIIVVLFAYMIVSAKRGSGLFKVRSGARRMTPEEGGVTFADVAGQDAAVAELREIKDFLADPERFAALGAVVPKGILLYGPPGCGKTLLAKALAGEAGASFWSISGSDFVELYVGVGAARVRDLFTEAREHAPALVFIDELDSIGRARGMVGAAQSHGEQEQALNQILAELDGFSPTEGIIVLAATNRPDVLDQALLRPGRFDRTVALERPDEASRLAILQLHAATKALDEGVDLADIARRAIGMTGADLASVLNEGALLTARAGKTVISQAELDIALARILEAPERQRRLSLREKSVARRAGADQRATFADVAGADDALAELSEVRDYLAEPERFAAMGARAPRGILLSGPPGCGKTLLARAVAGEANAAFLSVAGSEFVEIFVGEGSSRVRELFAEARSMAPAIVFIDEIDSIGAARGAGGDGHREREQTLNQILVELDGFQPSTAVIVMAATNRPDILDPALVRPGRFDRHVALSLPDRAGRRDILALHAEGKPLAPDVDLDAVAALTRGFSGADLANVLNEAALLATRRGLSAVTMAEVDEGFERATLGVASRGTLMSDQERRVVAYHEAGHALVALSIPDGSPPHKLTIVPRGGALGFCSLIDTHDRVMSFRSGMRDEMAVLLGGRVAEELVFADPGSGASSDLQRAGHIARQMVCELGMSDAVGPLVYQGRGGTDGGRGYCDEDAHTIYTEVRRLLEEAHARALAVLTEQRPALETLAQALLEQETLTGAEVESIARKAQPTPVAIPS